MADYEKCITATLLSEGYKEKYKTGYVKDPNDNGGETIAGIARKYWGSYAIWSIVDAAKKLKNFPNNLVNNHAANDLIKQFYQQNFWSKINGDKISDNDIAQQLVDTAVLEGLVPAIKRAEHIVGLEETGHISQDLLDKLNSF